MTQPVPVAPPEAPLALWLLPLGVPLLLIGLACLPDPDAPGVMWPLAALGVVLAVAFFLAPRRLAYTLTPEALVITRLLGRAVLPYPGMRARRSQGRLGLRTFGTGLPGYLTGHFTFGSDAVKNVRAAASRSRGGVIVESGGAAYFLTPADPDGFLRALARRGVRVAA